MKQKVLYFSEKKPILGYALAKNNNIFINMISNIEKYNSVSDIS